MLWYNEKFPGTGGPYWVMVLFLILTLLMIVELIAENVHIRNVKEEIPELEEEIIRLKAKLYDQSEEDDDDEEDGDDDEDDDDD